MGYSHKDHTMRVPANMQQRHFEFTASIIREQVDEANAMLSTGIELDRVRARTELGVLHSLAREFASSFKRSNPKFNRDRFMTACGLEA